MITKLPRWVWVGAWVLAAVAGFINVIGLLGFEHQAITHLTGTTSMLGAALSRADGAMALHLAAVIFSFLAGCMLSGFIVKNTTLQLGRHYGVALFLESALLCAAVPLLGKNSGWGMYAAACACGLQNAMVSTYSGAVVRTTHLSGMFTDLGIFLGHGLRGLPVERRRIRLCLLIISGFLAGGIAGAAVYRVASYQALYVPAGVVFFTAMGYVLYEWRHRSAPPPKVD